MKTLADLYEHMLRDVYHAEKQVKKLLPKFVKASTDDTLVEVLTKELEDADARLLVVEAAFEAIDKRARTVPCDAMIGLVKEGAEVMEEADENAMDAGVLAAYQAIKHYEITRFGTLGAWANRLGDMKMAASFSKLVTGCKAVDEQLSELAETIINPEADDEGEAGALKLGSNGNDHSKNVDGAGDHSAQHTVSRRPARATPVRY